MSVDLVKRVSIDPVRKTIKVTSASNNVMPRSYEAWNPLAGGHFTFESWLEAFANDCYNGSCQFLPSCESQAHEAYLRTCAELGGDWLYAYNTWLFHSREYEDFRHRWCKRFLEIVLSGERDRRKFVMSRSGSPVNVSFRRVACKYGDAISCKWRHTGNPEQVSWVRQAVITRYDPEFTAVPVA